MRLPTYAAVFLLLLSAHAFAAAPEEPPPPAPDGEGVLFGTAIFSSGGAAANLPVVILARSNSSESIHRLITDANGQFILSLGAGKYEIDALLADSGTAAIDHAATAQADTAKEENITLVFYPAGSITGTVELDGAPVSGARVKVACPSSSFDYSRVNGGATVQAGEAGDFIFKALPVGTCQFSASTDSLAGSAEAAIEYEKTGSVIVEMKKKAAGTDWLPLALAAIIVAIVAYSAFNLLRKEKSRKEFVAAKLESEPPEKKTRSNYGMLSAKKRKAENEEEPSFADKLSDTKVKAVLATLSDREKEIVKFLFKSGGRAKRSQLQHKLLIPKTSLLRNLRSLERKKIVKLTPFGRNLLAEIDGWLHK